MLHQPSIKQLLKKSYFLTKNKAREKTHNELIVHSCAHDPVPPLGQVFCLLRLFQILRLPLYQQGDRAYDSLAVLKYPMDTADVSKSGAQRPVKRKGKVPWEQISTLLPTPTSSKCLFNGLLWTGAEPSLFDLLSLALCLIQCPNLDLTQISIEIE